MRSISRGEECLKVGQHRGKGRLAGCDRKPRQKNPVNDWFSGLRSRMPLGVRGRQIDHQADRRPPPHRADAGCRGRGFPACRRALRPGAPAAVRRRLRCARGRRRPAARRAGAPNSADCAAACSRCQTSCDLPAPAGPRISAAFGADQNGGGVDGCRVGRHHVAGSRTTKRAPSTRSCMAGSAWCGSPPGCCRHALRRSAWRSTGRARNSARSPGSGRSV